eukprot:CAMPEP_0197184478 /NCGR_PEP_ID=MMETSP1423-20130617/9973_1 /TAXON_ID=476441 /ORGANISM="Pseudo-nitzschia heimii, Strain UNC1101" /LENGTH=802 /DNA_ID=CAMNT_0042635295 /DNA_START=70 /DNA_END=2478 /DNA_ORIENTATION=-
MGLSSWIIASSLIGLAFSAAYALEQQQQRLLRRSNQRKIETQEIEPGLFSIAVSPPPQNNDADTIWRRKLKENNFCTLFREDIYYEHEDPENLEDRWVCTFDEYFNLQGDDPFPYSAYIEGENLEITEAYLERNNIISGTHTLHWDSPSSIELDEEENTITLNADVTEDNSGLWIQPIEESNERKLQFLARTTGIKKTLVIRIVGAGIGPADDLVQIRDEVFGENVGLKSQMEACSHGQLIIEPYQGRTQGIFTNEIHGGVVELRIGPNPYGKTDKDMENAAMSAAWYVFGDLRSQFDLVMFVMPPGIKPAFAAYAYIGTEFSYYSDLIIRDAMVQMHEVGHNLGLQHSGQDHEEYGDSSGYMGYSSAFDPVMCYNAVNNYQLGWYSAHSFSPIADGGTGGTFLITGVHRYDPDDAQKFVSLRLVQDSMPKDYYIGYNKAEGMNIDSQEDRDKVIIYEKDGESHESKLSWKLAALSMGEMYVIDDFDASGKYVTVTFTDVVEHAAVVEVLPESSEAPTLTPLPSQSPTGTPSSKPSATPTRVPSIHPSVSPSESPSFSPSISSSPSVSSKPSSSPSDRPSSFPTISPAPTVSSAPSSLPSESPTNFPTVSSAPSLSFAPSTIPSASPTDFPTRSPSTSPTDLPSGIPSRSPSSAPTCANELYMKIAIQSDVHPEEISWKLKQQGGSYLNQIFAGDYTEKREKYKHYYCLEYDSCYRFSIFDEKGDGMAQTSDNDTGFYAVFLGGKLQVRHIGDWGKKRSHKICTPPDPSSFISVDLVNGEDTSTVESSEIYVQLDEAEGDNN